MAILPRTVDERGLYFTALGLGGPMRPEAAQELVTRRCEQLALPTAVPTDVRREFEKVVRLYGDGLFTYDNYTSASREAHRVLEVALKVRFLEHYAAGVPLTIAGAAEAATPRKSVCPRKRLAPPGPPQCRRRADRCLSPRRSTSRRGSAL